MTGVSRATSSTLHDAGRLISHAGRLTGNKRDPRAPRLMRMAHDDIGRVVAGVEDMPPGTESTLRSVMWVLDAVQQDASYVNGFGRTHASVLASALDDVVAGAGASMPGQGHGEVDGLLAKTRLTTAMAGAGAEQVAGEAYASHQYGLTTPVMLANQLADTATQLAGDGSLDDATRGALALLSSAVDNQATRMKVNAEFDPTEIDAALEAITTRVTAAEAGASSRVTGTTATGTTTTGTPVALPSATPVSIPISGSSTAAHPARPTTVLAVSQLVQSIGSRVQHLANNSTTSRSRLSYATEGIETIDRLMDQGMLPPNTIIALTDLQVELKAMRPFIEANEPVPRSVRTAASESYGLVRRELVGDVISPQAARPRAVRMTASTLDMASDLVRRSLASSGDSLDALRSATQQRADHAAHALREIDAATAGRETHDKLNEYLMVTRWLHQTATYGGGISDGLASPLASMLSELERIGATRPPSSFRAGATKFAGVDVYAAPRDRLAAAREMLQRAAQQWIDNGTIRHDGARDLHRAALLVEDILPDAFRSDLNLLANDIIRGRDVHLLAASIDTARGFVDELLRGGNAAAPRLQGGELAQQIRSAVDDLADLTASIDATSYTTHSRLEGDVSRLVDETIPTIIAQARATGDDASDAVAVELEHAHSMLTKSQSERGYAKSLQYESVGEATGSLQTALVLARMIDETGPMVNGRALLQQPASDPSRVLGAPRPSVDDFLD